MRAAKLSIAAVALFTGTAFTFDHPVTHLVSLLPEVQKHLEDGRTCSLNGSPDVAVAHANLVLVGDEVKFEAEYEGVPDRLRGRCKKALDGAVDAWQRALDHTIAFRAVTEPDQADIVIRFKPTVTMGREEVAGYANWKRTLKSDGPKVQEVSFKSLLQIRTLNLDGNAMPQDCVRHEVAHEIGHVLGLDDSVTTGDLMGPLDIGHPVGGPQSYEADAVRHLRDEAHKLRTDSLARCNKAAG